MVSTAAAPLRSDEVMFDGPTHRLYVPGGEGYIGIYDTSDPDHVKQIGKVPSAPGAKTGILLPDMKKMMLAASPGESKNVAKIMTYELH